MREGEGTGKTYEDHTKGIELIIKEDMAGAPEGQWAYIDLGGGGSSAAGLGVMYLRTNQMTRQRLDELAPTQPVMLEDSSNYLMNTAARNDFMKLFDVEATDHNEKAAMSNPR